MKSSQFLKEGTDNLYHATSPHSALKILTSGKFELTSHTGNDVETAKSKDGYDFYLSLTRSKVGDYHARSYKSGVVMNLDGRWLNQRYPIKPVDYWERMWYNSTTGGVHDGRTSEAEDRLYSKKPTIPITPLQEIHIYWKEDANPDFNFIVRRIMIEAKKQRYPVFLYDDLKQWLAQNKAKAMSVSDAQSRLKGQEKTSWGAKRDDPYMNAWLELYYKKDPDELSEKGKRTYRDLWGWADPSDGLKNDLRNAAKPSSMGRSPAMKILQIMRKHKLQTAKDYVDFIRKKWEPIKDRKNKEERAEWERQQAAKKATTNESVYDAESLFRVQQKINDLKELIDSDFLDARAKKEALQTIGHMERELDHLQHGADPDDVDQMIFADVHEDYEWDQDEDQDMRNPLPIITDASVFDLMDEVDGEITKDLEFSTGPEYGQAVERMRKKYGTVQEVPIKQIVSTEKYLVSDHIKAIQAGGARSSSHLPILYKQGNKYYAGDGNHRIVADYLAKKPTTKGLVLDADQIL